MSLTSPILGLSSAVSSFFSFSLFFACIVLVAHNIVELQSDKEWVENESVDKDYPQKVTLENHYCNHQYPLKTSSRNIVFVPGELSRAARKRCVFAPYQFHMTFLGFVESVRRRSVEHSRTDSKVNVCKFPCNSASGDDVNHFCAAAAFGRIRGLMLPTPDPFVATIMIRIHSVIYHFFYGNFVGKLFVLCLVYS